MKNDKPVSNCCQAPIRTGGLPKNPIKDKMYTMWNECTKCGNICHYYEEKESVEEILQED